MEVKGILKKRVTTRSGVSQRTGNGWRTDEWLVVIPGSFERKISFEVRGEERCKQWEDFFNGMPDKNAPVIVKFEIDAHEYEDRYINSVQAWDICISQW